MSQAETQRLRKEIQVQVIEQIHSWGMFQNKQVFSWDENMEQPWGLGSSPMAVLYRASVSWMVWDSLLFCPTGMETSQMLFLGRP